MICLLGSTNSKLISSCARFTCRIRILVKCNEPSLQEIPTTINYWNQEAGYNHSPLSFPSPSLLWPCADNLHQDAKDMKLHLKHMMYRETSAVYWQFCMLNCVAAYITLLTRITWIIWHTFPKTDKYAVLQSAVDTLGKDNYFSFPQGGMIPFAEKEHYSVRK